MRSLSHHGKTVAGSWTDLSLAFSPSVCIGTWPHDRQPGRMLACAFCIVHCAFRKSCPRVYPALSSSVLTDRSLTSLDLVAAAPMWAA
jgi:hypothetical protein